MHRHWDHIIWERQEAYRHRFGEHLSLEQLAALSGARPRVVKRLEALDLIDRIWIEGRAVYSVSQVPRVRKVLRLRYDLGLSWSSMDLVLRLLDRVEELESKLDRLEPESGDHRAER